MTDHYNFVNLLGIKDIYEVLGNQAEGVECWVCGLIGSTVPEHVGDNEAISSSIEEADLVPPIIRRAWKPM